MLFSILQTASNEILNESTTSIINNSAQPNTSPEKNGSDTVVDKVFKGQDIDKSEFERAYEEFKSGKNNSAVNTKTPNARLSSSLY